MTKLRRAISFRASAPSPLEYVDRSASMPSKRASSDCVFFSGAGGFPPDENCSRGAGFTLGGTKKAVERAASARAVVKTRASMNGLRSTNV